MPSIDGSLAPNKASKPVVAVKEHGQPGIAQQDEANGKVTGKRSRTLSGDSDSPLATNSVTGNVTLENGKIHQPKKQRTHGSGSAASDELVPDSEEQAEADEKVNKIKGQLLETSDYSWCSSLERETRGWAQQGRYV